MGAQIFTLPSEYSTPIDEVPSDFDVKTCPIIARHIFGLRPIVAAFPRKRTAGPRSLGPGERAAARACRERGFRVIEGGRP